jgi:hypothetical protein
MVAWGNFLAGRTMVRADGTPVTDAAVIQFPIEGVKKGRARGNNGRKSAIGCRKVKQGAAVRRTLPHSNRKFELKGRPVASCQIGQSR